MTYVPCSGLSGENLIHQPLTEELLKWYKGNTLLEEIDLMEPPSRLVDRPLRCSVTDIFKGGVDRAVCEAFGGCGLGCVLIISLYPDLCSGWACMVAVFPFYGKYLHTHAHMHTHTQTHTRTQHTHSHTHTLLQVRVWVLVLLAALNKDTCSAGRVCWWPQHGR